MSNRLSNSIWLRLPHRTLEADVSTPFTRRDIRPCAVCGKPPMTGNPLGIFWRVRAERLIIDHAAVRREAGLEMMMGGSVALAEALSPERGFAQQLAPPRDMLICDPCVMDRCGDIAGALFKDTGDE